MKKRGFTLVELLVVIAIIGVLSSVVFATLSSSRARARGAAALQTFGSVTATLRVCMNDGLSINYPNETQNGRAAAAPGVPVLTCTGGAEYVALPAGWIYCDNVAGLQTATTCGNDISQQVAGSSFSFVVESPADASKITCTQDGCTKVADSD
jgi:prepilin-type N-terminal cleavage/methylation domain-containing protein